MKSHLAVPVVLLAVAVAGAPEKQAVQQHFESKPLPDHPAIGKQAVREDLQLRAFLLEGLFKTHAKPDEICYVAFGTKPDKKTRQAIHVDPPAEFLERFKGRPFQVKPASAYPRPEGVPLPIKNPKTGIPDGIYTVEITAWVDENAARIKAGMYRSGLWASGYEAVVEKRDGKWEIKQRGESRIS